VAACNQEKKIIEAFGEESFSFYSENDYIFLEVKFYFDLPQTGSSWVNERDILALF